MSLRSRFWQAIVLLNLLGVAVPVYAADLWAELDAGQQEQIKKGGTVVLTENIEGKPWPRVKIFRIVEATAEEVAAVFFDYNDAKLFVPNVLKSQVCNRLSSCTMDIDYGLNVPILPNEYYTMRNTLALDGSTYCFTWKMLKAIQTKDSVGGFRIEPYNGGKALFCYQNLVTPNSGMAVLLRGKAISQMKETAEAIGNYVEKQKTTNPEGLQKDVEALRTALSAQS